MNLLMMERARILLETCLGVVSGQTLLVLDDATLGSGMTEAFVYAGKAIGARPLTMSYKPSHYLSMREFGLFGGASLKRHDFRLPRPVVEAMEASDVVMMLTSDMEVLFDEGFWRVARGGSRIGGIFYIDEDSFIRLHPETAEEAIALHKMTQAVGNLFAQSTEAIVQSDAGTDIRMQIGNYRINWGTGLFEPGRGYGGVCLWPGGQISTMPNAGTAEGRLVIDRSVNAPEFKELLDPIEFTVVNGYVTKIEGGREARRMADFLASLDDGGEAYHLTELGVGTNERCKVAGVAGPGEDTHTFGCVSLALGADVHLGGETVAGCHLDMTMRAASLTLGGQIVVENGHVVV